MLRIAPILHLTRVSSAFAAVGNVWFVILWTRANAGHEGGVALLADAPLWFLLPAGALSALGLYIFGALLNDALDLKRDRTIHPSRPLPSGNVSIDAAVGMIVLALLAAVLGATAFGTTAVLLTLTLAAAILVLNAAGKFIPGAGLVLLGLVYAGHMMVPNARLKFVWPVWLVMTHALCVGGLAHVMARRVPRLSTRAVIAAAAGWAFWSGVLFWIGWERADRPAWFWPPWVDPVTAAWPLALIPPFALIAAWKIRQHGPGPRAADKIGRYGSLWLPLYAAAWLIGAGHSAQGLVLLGLAAAALVGMTMLREVYGLVESPLAFKR
jgi:4-hydroxybenzoate polyprenyltransferase